MDSQRRKPVPSFHLTVLEEVGERKALLPGHTLSHFPFISFNEYHCSFLYPFYQQNRVLLCQICLRANGVAANL